MPECRETEMIKSFADKKLKALWGRLRNSSRISGVDQKRPELVNFMTKSDKISSNVPDSFSCDA